MLADDSRTIASTATTQTDTIDSMNRCRELRSNPHTHSIIIEI